MGSHVQSARFGEDDRADQPFDGRVRSALYATGEFTLSHLSRLLTRFLQAIMVNGEFKCVGSTQHLKNKYGEGFVLTIKCARKSSEFIDIMRTESQEMLKEKNSVKYFIESKFSGAVLK